MFLKVNDKIVNLNNVGDVNILLNRNRIVFNMNCSVVIDDYNGDEKQISDYVYWDGEDDEEFENMLHILRENSLIQENFIEYYNGYVNLSEISSIKYLPLRYRIIFNLSNNITFYDKEKKKNKITTKYIFIDCKSENEYQVFKYNLENKIEIKD